MQIHYGARLLKELIKVKCFNVMEDVTLKSEVVLE